ncbi:MAG: hypothetical protein Ta2A_24590 [Treponemataceae bacterium]|nr:MAG: hypothetical protein Ta2A_24590 [Treponemataceae bacterium]
MFATERRALYLATKFPLSARRTSRAENCEVARSATSGKALPAAPATTRTHFPLRSHNTHAELACRTRQRRKDAPPEPATEFAQANSWAHGRAVDTIFTIK